MSGDALHRRDDLLSRGCGAAWPQEPLLTALKLSPTWDVLDIGAGRGALGAALRLGGHRGQIVGIDPSPGAPDIHLGHAEALPFAPQSFDAVLFVRVLAHLPDPGAALAEARRVLRPGGRVIVAANGAGHLSAFWRRLGREIAPPSPPALHTRTLTLPLQLSAAEAQALALTYGADWPGGVLKDQVQLAVDEFPVE